MRRASCCYRVILLLRDGQAHHRGFGVVAEAHAVHAIETLQVARSEQRSAIVGADHGTVDRTLDLVGLDSLDLGKRDLVSCSKSGCHWNSVDHILRSYA